MNLKNILSEVAPFIGSLFGSPLAGIAIKTLGSFLLNDENATQESIEKELGRVSPEILIKLKQIDADLKSKFLEAGLNQEKIDSFDRNSARDREIRSGDKMPAILSIFLTFGFFSIIFMMIFYNVPEKSINLINIMIGCIGTSWTSCITYYFGSSHGSKIKSEIMGNNYGINKK